MHLKILLSHCSSAFFPFHKLHFWLYIAKFWCIYVIGIKIKSPGLFQCPPPPTPFIVFHCPYLLRPFSLPFIWDIRVFTIRKHGFELHKKKHYFRMSSIGHFECLGIALYQYSKWCKISSKLPIKWKYNHNTKMSHCTVWLHFNVHKWRGMSWVFLFFCSHILFSCCIVFRFWLNFILFSRKKNFHSKKK